MSSNYLTSIPKLKGRENFDDWAFAVENLLILEGAEKYLKEEGKEAPAVALDARARAKLILTIDSSLCVHIKETKTTKELWTKLRALFDDSGFSRRITLLRHLISIRSEQRNNREDARAALPDQQMRSGTPRYPVDRYLVESSKKIEMVNIIDEEIWNPEPVLRPEDELILRKLHEMLQSTADDLKFLSGELSKFHEPGVQVKTHPTPLDEEFNEKVHIEEVVNAKFHGYKIVDKKSSTPSQILKVKDVVEGIKSVVNNLQEPKDTDSTAVQIKTVPTVKKTVLNKKLGISRMKTINIKENDENNKNNIQGNELNNVKVTKSVPAVAYKELSYKYVEPKIKVNPLKNLQIQVMPRINIRSELKEQKVLHLDIIPDAKTNKENTVSKGNVAVISVDHEAMSILNQEPNNKQPNEINDRVQYSQPTYINNRPIRKVSKMTTLDSSGSTNSVSSDTQYKLNTQKQIKSVLRSSPKSSVCVDRSKNKQGNLTKKDSDKHSHYNLDEWKKKLNLVYGQPSTAKKSKTSSSSNAKKVSPKKSNLRSRTIHKPQSNLLNNAEYIPYSQLTLGGIRVSDIERDISDIPNKNDIPLSPILDRILSSRENSIKKDSSRIGKRKENPNILTTSDENLLQEVIDIELSVSKTIAKNLKKKGNKALESAQTISSESQNVSYVEDFEDVKTDSTEPKNKIQSSGSQSERLSSHKSGIDDNNELDNNNDDDYDKDDDKSDRKTTNIRNTTYTKTTNLSFKNSVDIFEFVHNVDTQDTATQSNSIEKITPKETQTSPRNDKTSIQPIHNDLWPSIDPHGEVEEMFKLEKDFIKKIIMDEYGDMLEKNITKPSTSNLTLDEDNKAKNVVASQKNTQTSPAHVKSVMTSPTRTKTRTTSPYLSLSVDHQTSPMIVVTNETELNVEVDNEELGISINLSSPRFSLRLPQSSREVLSNLDVCRVTANEIEKDKVQRNKSINNIGSSSSIDADNSSSEISSLGEIKMKLKRKLKKSRITPISETSSSSTVSKYSSDLQSGGILPLRSEGEVSLGQTGRKVLNKPSRSDGEASFGLFFK